MLTPEGRRLRAIIAIGTRRRGPNDPQVLASRAELRTEKAITAIRELVHAHPPLHPDQLARIAAAVHEREAVQQ